VPVRRRGHLEFALGNLSLHVTVFRVNLVYSITGECSAYDLSSMLEKKSPLTHLRNELAAGTIDPLTIARDTIERANGSASRNTYLYFNADALLEQAATLEQTAPLFGIPVSLKDCFDLKGTHTTCGTRFYADFNPPALTDSAVAASIRKAGALLTGKTHLHPLAYGITGQNPDYGDCLQPRDATLLAGGSSSGAVASVQEGSALAAIGTDTGGSIRVPAALSGLTGFRASHNLASPGGWFPQAWAGAAHLAPSFDTLGIVLRDPRDAAPISEALFNIPLGSVPSEIKIGCVPESFLYDCEADVLTAYRAWQQTLTSMSASVHTFDTSWWSDTFEYFAGIQAHEAAAIHHGHFDQFEPSIKARLEWGASITAAELNAFKIRHEQFRAKMNELFNQFDLLMLPTAPVSRLSANTDLSKARQIILRYTTPFSLAGVPALSLPGEIIGAAFGTGVQIAAAVNADPVLLAFAAAVGDHLIT
jgi:aspartyl-tRNA(Asn)/glutamyl-tRNA(Gln) amidotransferase subunit A